MKDGITKILGTLVLAASLGLVVGCDMPEEKKSVFQPATTSESDSSKMKHGQPDPSKPDAKKDEKKPRAFSKVDRVVV